MLDLDNRRQINQKEKLEKAEERKTHKSARRERRREERKEHLGAYDQRPPHGLIHSY